MGVIGVYVSGIFLQLRVYRSMNVACYVCNGVCIVEYIYMQLLISI